MLVRLLVQLLRAYRFALSPLLGPVCRFHPSCSRYAEGCLLTHGIFRGSILALKRLAKCHPFHPGGYDPVPPRGNCCTSVLPQRQQREDSSVKAIALAVTSHEGPI
jgi:uncharacterized protein